MRHATPASGRRAAPLPDGGRIRWITTKGFRSPCPPFQGFGPAQVARLRAQIGNCLKHGTGQSQNCHKWATDCGDPMTWLFFTDESGHDHKQMPYEVRGGFAIHVSKLWPFAQAMQLLEKECFGCRLSDVGTEIKGSSLLKAKRFEFAAQGVPIPDHDRRQLCRFARFLRPIAAAIGQRAMGSRPAVKRVCAWPKESSRF